jgi:hypothetical protein
LERLSRSVFQPTKKLVKSRGTVFLFFLSNFLDSLTLSLVTLKLLERP